jgi:hypothetical protein
MRLESAVLDRLPTGSLQLTFPRHKFFVSVGTGVALSIVFGGICYVIHPLVGLLVFGVMYFAIVHPLVKGMEGPDGDMIYLFNAETRKIVRDGKPWLSFDRIESLVIDEDNGEGGHCFKLIMAMKPNGVWWYLVSADDIGTLRAYACPIAAVMGVELLLANTVTVF